MLLWRTVPNPISLPLNLYSDIQTWLQQPEPSSFSWPRPALISDYFSSMWKNNTSSCSVLLLVIARGTRISFSAVVSSNLQY